MSTFSFAQSNSEKIKAKWIIEKFEVEKNTPNAIQAQKDLQGVCLTFGDEQLIISKMTETCEDVINKGPYLLSGNSLTIGKDQADVILLSQKQLSIKIPGQGILYLSKM